MNSVSWIIIYFVIFVVCCALLGYMGRNRKTGSRKAGFIPFVLGIVTATILLWIYSRGGFPPGSWMADLRNVFLLPFIASLALGYGLVKMSPRAPGFRKELERIYDRAIRHETAGETRQAIDRYREAMQKLVHERSRLDRDEARKYDDLVEKLQAKISSLHGS